MTVVLPTPAIDTAPVPDVVIRPITPGSGLPAVIEPKPAKRWAKMAAGVVVAVVLLAAGAFVFRQEIVDQLPSDLLALLRLKA